MRAYGRNTLTIARNLDNRERRIQVSGNHDSREECHAVCGVCVASRPTTHNTSRLFSLLRLMVQKSHGDDASVAEARVIRRHASLKKFASTSTCGAKFWNLSQLTSHVVPIVNEAIGVSITGLPRGCRVVPPPTHGVPSPPI